MKTLYLTVIRLLICVIIGWLLSTLIEENFNPINWGVCGITFMVMFVVLAVKYYPKRVILRWLGGAMFVSLFIMVMAYFTIFCIVQNMNPFEWDKILRVILSTLIGSGFILGGRLWKVLVKLSGLNQFFNLDYIKNMYFL